MDKSSSNEISSIHPLNNQWLKIFIYSSDSVTQMYAFTRAMKRTWEIKLLTHWGLFFFQMEQFLLSDLQLVFPLDSLASSHPISVDVDHPKKIKQLFDRISYSKVLVFC